MGYMKGAGDEHENKYLIDENNTRTDLVKKILVEHLIPKLDFCDKITINTFLNNKKRDNQGNPIFVKKKYVEFPDLIQQYSGSFEINQISNSLKQMKNPQPGGTPLRWALLNRIHNLTSQNDLIVFSDGDGYINLSTDEDWHTTIGEKLEQLKKQVRIHIVGIAQSQVVQEKSKFLCDATNGIFVNLKAMNYDVNVLNQLLFNLKADITSIAIDTSLQIQPLQKKVGITKEAEQPKIEEEIKILEVPEKIDFEGQVIKNTKSLSLISNQLDNIVSLLQSKSQSGDNLEVVEDEIHNKRVGHLAEKFLYQELLKNNWEKVEWLNEHEEKYCPYDFIVTDMDKTFYYECKGTSSNGNEFLLTRQEWECYLDHKGSYRVCFVSNVDTLPSYVRFEDLLENLSRGQIIPCSAKNKIVRKNRIIFQVATK